MQILHHISSGPLRPRCARVRGPVKWGVPDLVIHPTRKWLRVQYTAVFVIACVTVFIINNYASVENEAVLALPALLFLYPMFGSLRRRFTKIRISEDKLRYETGVLSRSTRTIQLSKIQDVCVDQTLWQRLMGIGTLSFETAGETSRLAVANIDDPQAVADHIIDVAHAQQPKRKGERA